MNLLLAGSIVHLVICGTLDVDSGDIEVFGARVTILEENPAKVPVEQLALDLVEIVTVFSAKL